jgi:hypothetical protein
VFLKASTSPAVVANEQCQVLLDRVLQAILGSRLFAVFPSDAINSYNKHEEVSGEGLLREAVLCYIKAFVVHITSSECSKLQRNKGQNNSFSLVIRAY